MLRENGRRGLAPPRFVDRSARPSPPRSAEQCPPCLPRLEAADPAQQGQSTVAGFGGDVRVTQTQDEWNNADIATQVKTLVLRSYLAAPLPLEAATA